MINFCLFSTLHSNGYKSRTYSSLLEPQFSNFNLIYFDKNILNRAAWKIIRNQFFSAHDRLNQEFLWGKYCSFLTNKDFPTLFSLRLHSSVINNSSKIRCLDFSENLPNLYIDNYLNICSKFNIFPSKFIISNKFNDSIENSIKIADKIMVYSEDLKSAFNKRYPSKQIFVNKLPPEYVDHSKSDVSDEIVFFHVGQISILKGSLELFEFWSKYNIKYRLICYGDIQPCMIHYLKFATLSDKIEFRKYAPFPEILVHAKQFKSIFCLPSLTEGVSRTMLNSIYSGIPTISSYVPSYLKKFFGVFQLPPHFDDDIFKDKMSEAIKFYETSQVLDMQSQFTEIPTSKDFVENIISKITSSKGDN